MSTTELKSNIHVLIDNTNDSSVLNLIYSLLSKFKRSRNETVKLSVSEKKAIDQALKSVENDRVYSHSKIMADMQKKYPFLIK